MKTIGYCGVLRLQLKANTIHRLWIKLSLELKIKAPELKWIIETIGPPSIQFEKNHFRALVESILSQQLAPKAAQTIINRFKNLYPPFPTVDVLQNWKIQKLRSVGISGQKASYILSLVEYWKNPKWRKNWSKLDDQLLIERLTEVKGIGTWTAQMFLIFAMGRPNILPTGDYGVRQGIQRLYRLPEIPIPHKIPSIVEHWVGAFSVGSWYLWQAIDQKLLPKEYSFLRTIHNSR